MIERLAKGRSASKGDKLRKENHVLERERPILGRQVQDFPKVGTLELKGGEKDLGNRRKNGEKVLTKIKRTEQRVGEHGQKKRNMPKKKNRKIPQRGGKECAIWGEMGQKGKKKKF